MQQIWKNGRTSIFLSTFISLFLGLALGLWRGDLHVKRDKDSLCQGVFTEGKDLGVRISEDYYGKFPKRDEAQLLLKFKLPARLSKEAVTNYHIEGKCYIDATITAGIGKDQKKDFCSRDDLKINTNLYPGSVVPHQSARTPLHLCITDEIEEKVRKERGEEK